MTLARPAVAHPASARRDRRGRVQPISDLSTALAESLAQMVVMTSPNGEVTYCNEAWTRYTGLGLEQTRNVQPRNLVHPQDEPAMLDRWERALATGEGFEMELRFRRHDGQLRWHLCSARPVRLGDGTIHSWISSSTDINEAMRSRERERFLGTAVAAISSSLDFDTTLASLAGTVVPEFADICVVDMFDHGGPARRVQIKSVRPELVEVLRTIEIGGWRTRPGSDERSRDRILSGEGWLASVTEAWLDAVTDSPEQAHLAKMLGVTSFISAPLKARNQVLGALTLALTGTERDYDDADLLLAMELAHRAAIAIDNARLYQESQESAERLRVANQAKDEFLSLVSHEMRTPITTIYGNAQVLQRLWDRLEDSDRRMALTDIEAEAERLRRVIENMLVLARIESGRGVATEPVLLNRLAQMAIRELKQRNPAREVVLDIEPGLPPVAAQPAHVELVLRNLLNNSAKYSPLDSPIELTITVVGRQAQVCVADAGPGVTPEELEHIFQPFYRSELTAAAPGAGLGLAVCRRLVEAQGGTIWAANREPNGLAVCFRLPLDETA